MLRSSAEVVAFNFGTSPNFGKDLSELDVLPPDDLGKVWASSPLVLKPSIQETGFTHFGTSGISGIIEQPAKARASVVHVMAGAVRINPVFLFPSECFRIQPYSLPLAATSPICDNAR